MRAVLYILASIAALGAAFALYTGAKPAESPSSLMTAPQGKTLVVGTTTVLVEVADTPEERSRGLGGRAELPEGQGMWFVFDMDDYWGFWMKDTLIPLDMLWVAADGTIITIAHEITPESYPQVFKPSKPARYVLEVPGGYAKRHGIREGHKIDFSLTKVSPL